MGALSKKGTSPPIRGSSSGKPTIALPNTYTRRIKDERNKINELRRKNLFFSCKQPWTLGHHYLSKGAIHYIEAFLEGDSFDDEHEDIYE